MIRNALALSLLFTGLAEASYVQTCILHGVIKGPIKTSAETMEFDLEVKTARNDLKGRTDGTCQVPAVAVHVVLAKSVLRSGDSVWVRDFYKDNGNSEPFHLFTLLTEAEAKAATTP